MVGIRDFPMVLGTQMGKMESSPDIFKLIAAGGRALNTSPFKLVVEDLQQQVRKIRYQELCSFLTPQIN